MEKTNKVYIAGHNGLVGSAIVRNLQRAGYEHLIVRTHQELDLTDQAAVERFFKEETPEYVFLCAAKVGGIRVNSMQPADFLYINLVIETNVIHSAYLNKVEKLVFIGSGCVYPRDVLQPIKEEYLLDGQLEKTNEAYALAKIAGVKMCEYYNTQYNTKYISVLPCNLYGPGDNYNPTSSHVIPALLRKFHDAKINSRPTVTMWGTGTAMREFLHIDDVADASIFLMQEYNENEWLNLGNSTDITIRELGELVKKVVGYRGEIVYDSSYPDGTPRKLLDSSKLMNLGWRPSISFEEGLRDTYSDYLKNNENYRK